MSLIPEEELRKNGHLNLAPLVDFLFLVLAVFAVIAVTRAALFDSEISLVKVNPIKDKSQVSAIPDETVINLSVTEKGQYKWITEFNEYTIPTPAAIQQELRKQQDLGLIPQQKDRVKILLHIDKKAEWEPIVQLIFAIKESGYTLHPVYEPQDS